MPRRSWPPPRSPTPPPKPPRPPGGALSAPPPPPPSPRPPLDAEPRVPIQPPSPLPFPPLVQPGCLHMSARNGKMYGDGVLLDYGNLTLGRSHSHTLRLDISLNRYFAPGDSTIGLDLLL
ncbi:hypothetical protein VaNZ11_016702 [Volvox africanus]|uniref:Pherophorin domain-containing protein n=1 Tax=Volvox africanus TaxID=51714 RepID=A0ABQ5SNY0_9CHLO|nr:hypothetical protein VaNZ11_016702 [Volvox africanus]